MARKQREKAPQRREPPWRTDPGWKLVQYDHAMYPAGQPPDRPSDDAELASPPYWATRYVENRPVATWYRPRPLRPSGV